MAPSIQRTTTDDAKLKGINKGSTKKKKLKQKKSETLKANQLINISCPICFEGVRRDAVSATKCGHVFCTGCLRQAVARKHRCPVCRASLLRRGGYHMLFL